MQETLDGIQGPALLRDQLPVTQARADPIKKIARDFQEQRRQDGICRWLFRRGLGVDGGHGLRRDLMLGRLRLLDRLRRPGHRFLLGREDLLCRPGGLGGDQRGRRGLDGPGCRFRLCRHRDGLRNLDPRLWLRRRL
jgi:hypothetical protein